MRDKKCVRSVSSSDNRELQIKKALFNVSSSGSRELQIQQALSTSSSRVPRTDNDGLQIKKALPTSSSRLSLSLLELTIFMLLTLFLLIPIFSQEVSESKTKYPHIKELLVARLTDQAQREIDKLVRDVPNDPTLNYYQTEVWFNKGEHAYNSGNFQKALEFYEKAFQFWSGNPLLAQRIKDTKEKINNPSSLTSGNQNPTSVGFNGFGTNSISNLLNGKGEQSHSTHSTSSGEPGSVTAGSGSPNINIIILDKETQEAFKIQLSGILEERSSKDTISVSKPYLVFFTSLGVCLVVANIISLTILFRGK